MKVIAASLVNAFLAQPASSAGKLCVDWFSQFSHSLS